MWDTVHVYIVLTLTENGFTEKLRMPFESENVQSMVVSLRATGDMLRNAEYC